MDSIYLYAQEVYYWNQQLPDKITYNKYKGSLKSTSEFDNLNDGLFYLSQFAKNPLTERPYEFVRAEGISKYTSIITSQQQDNLLNGFGLSLTTLNGKSLLVKYAIPSSPAATAGLKRGDEILSINGAEIENINNQEYKKLFSNNKLRLSYLADGGQQQLIELNKTSYIPSSIIDYQIISNNYGYISLINFPTYFTDLDKIFQIFASRNIENLIIDLRYNTGGFLSGCDQLVNHIIPDRLNNKVYRKEIYNKTLQEGKADILKNKTILDEAGTPVFFVDNRVGTFFDLDYSLKHNTYLFNKLGSYNSVKKIYIIVSVETSSASELLINALNPYIETMIIGVTNDQSQSIVRTFGKPIGSIAIPIGPFKVYYAMFQNVNVNNQGDYFEGIPSDWSTMDDIRKDFGDISDPAIKYCLTKTSKAGLQKESKGTIKTQDAYKESAQSHLLIKDLRK